MAIVSHATRLFGSCSKIASRTESLIWSHILSGWPSVTDSEVKVYVSFMGPSGSSGRISPGRWSIWHPIQDRVGEVAFRLERLLLD